MDAVPRLLVATSNADKIREITRLLAGVPIEIITLSAFPGVLPPEETGSTFAENARAKARYYAAATGELALAEDSGLEVDALGGAPGVHSARYGGASSGYPARFAQIYRSLREKEVDRSAARFVCAAAVARGDEVLFETEGLVEGEIAPEPKGSGGFGYDPIFYYPPFGTTLADAGDRKHLVSHRAAAMARVREFLNLFVARPFQSL